MLNMGTTVITHPDGPRTVIRSSSGCGSGCGWFVAVALVLSACAQVPVLIPLTVVILVAMSYVAWRQQHGGA